MASNRSIFRKYAPAWAVLFAAGATFVKSIGQHYILKREWELRWSDAGAALIGAAVGYATFRMQHGDVSENDAWYKR